MKYYFYPGINTILNLVCEHMMMTFYIFTKQYIYWVSLVGLYKQYNSIGRKKSNNSDVYIPNSFRDLGGRNLGLEQANG